MTLDLLHPSLLPTQLLSFSLSRLELLATRATCKGHPVSKTNAQKAKGRLARLSWATRENRLVSLTPAIAVILEPPFGLYLINLGP
jgi:hypothetical protein